VLLDKPTLDGIAKGDITLAFRRWKRPTVKQGGTLRTPKGVLHIRAVTPVDEAAITEDDARKAGEPSRQALIRRLRPEGQLYRVEFELGGADPRIALRESTEGLDALAARLARMGSWTTQTLELIDDNPGTRAADLAPHLQQERLAFKANVRKLKELGLTISLERGYRLSPRGQAYLRATRARRP
jgi:hypothetical protein